MSYNITEITQYLDLQATEQMPVEPTVGKKRKASDALQRNASKANKLNPEQEIGALHDNWRKILAANERELNKTKLLRILISEQQQNHEQSSGKRKEVSEHRPRVPQQMNMGAEMQILTEEQMRKRNEIGLSWIFCFFRAETKCSYEKYGSREARTNPRTDK